jgi:hypothetical protein
VRRPGAALAQDYLERNRIAGDLFTCDHGSKRDNRRQVVALCSALNSLRVGCEDRTN